MDKHRKRLAGLRNLNQSALVEEKPATLQAPATIQGDGAANRFLRRREVEQVTGLSKSTIYQKMAAGEFPRPIPLGKQARAWSAAEIAAWQAERIAERDKWAAA
jgi:prophage regulatory protein